jgi:2-polyprenyl-3-methyl-5-hydroxy-6-metoxy-1,4-benzoquinol methylase
MPSPSRGKKTPIALQEIERLVTDTARYDPFYGLVLPEHNWVPAPSYLLRRHYILSFLRSRTQRGELLEVGCGAGAMLEDYRQLGSRCTAVEISPGALAIATQVHASHSEVSIVDRFPGDASDRFDVLTACEVLEHIEDDVAALSEWAHALKPGGVAVLSVPGDPARFGPLDAWAGHYRRYTRESFAQLCVSAGLEPLGFETYGYPVVRLTEVVGNLMRGRSARREQSERGSSSARKLGTDRSGVERGIESRLFPLVDNRLGRAGFRGLFRLQSRFRDREVGNGLLCWAVKR